MATIVTTELLEPTKTLGWRIAVRTDGKQWRFNLVDLSPRGGGDAHHRAVTKAFPESVITPHPNHGETVGKRKFYRWVVGAPAPHAYLVTIKLPKNPDHNPHDKKLGRCEVSPLCSDSTGEHHTVLAHGNLEVDALRRSYHITRVEEVR